MGNERLKRLKERNIYRTSEFLRKKIKDVVLTLDGDCRLVKINYRSKFGEADVLER